MAKETKKAEEGLTKVKANNIEFKTLKKELDANKNEQKKLKGEAAALLKEEEEKESKLEKMHELKASGKPIKKSPKKPKPSGPLTIIDAQGRNWEIDEDGNKLRRI